MAESANHAETKSTTTASTPGWTKRLGRLGGRTILILLVLMFIVAAADRSRLRVDWSADNRFSLSPALISLLEKQHDQLELITVWPIEFDDLARPLLDGLRVIAERSPAITYRHIDPILHKPTLATFEKTYGAALVPAIYVVRPAIKRAFYIPVNSNTRIELQREIGGALVSLAEGVQPRISLLQGHGELRPDGGLDDGCNELIRAFELAGFDVHLSEIARDGKINPESLLIIAGATTPLGPDLAQVKAHIVDGGATFILGDDRLPQDLGDYLRTRGIMMGPSLPQELPSALQANGNFIPALSPGAPSIPPRIIVSLHRHLIGQESTFPHHNLLLDSDLMNPRHTALQRALLSGQSMLSPWTTPVQLLQPGAFDEETRKRLQQAYIALGTTPFTADMLLQTAPHDAWVKTRTEALQAPEQLDSQPALPLAWSIESMVGPNSVRDEQNARMVILGSRQAASDGILAQRRFANATFFTDLAHWALHRDRATAIPEAESKSFRVEASDSLLFWIEAFLVAVIPCFCIGFAILTWWDRR